MSLKSRITALSMVTILLVAAMLETVSDLSATRSEQRIADAVLAGNSPVWARLLEDEQSRIAEGVESFEQEFELRSPIKKSDAASVREAVDRTCQRSDDLLATSRERESHSATLESITGGFHGTGGGLASLQPLRMTDISPR